MPPSKRVIRKLRYGFTLVELLAAIVLAALLMLAMLSLVASLGRSQRALAAGDHDSQGHEAIVELIRQDLLMARQIQIAPNELTLLSYSSLDATTRQAGGLPVVITYRVQKTDQRQWLVRHQRPVNEHGSAAGWSELVCDHVSGFELLPPSQESRKPFAEAQGQPGSSVYRLVIRSPQQVMIDQTLVLH